MKPFDQIKRFGLNGLSIESAISTLEKKHNLSLRDPKEKVSEIDETYFPQFDPVFRAEAAEMSIQYRVFYCLENSIRSLISERLIDAFGESWWEHHVDGEIRKRAEGARQKEIDNNITPRSDQMIDYTSFGELGLIITHNEEVFADQFTSLKAVNKVLWSLNILRGPIAHCKPLAEDEILRLHLALRDWFKSMGE